MNIRTPLIFLFCAFSAASSYGQLLATDNFESNTSSPLSQYGGTGDWIGTWGLNTQQDGGAFLSSASKISGTKSVGLFGNGGSSGTSISRPFPACTNQLTILASFRGDINLESVNPPANRRVAFTIRTGNEGSHFGSQRLSFFFAQGSPNFQWYDGSDRNSNAVTYANGSIYDLRVVANPVDRSYSFVISNRNNGTTFQYSGNWTTGSAGDPLGSVAFMMRGPTGGGNDAFLDEVSISAPDYVPPPPAGPQFVEGDLWRYFKGTSTPAVQGTNTWTSVHYNESSWLGPAPCGFGYGDCDDNTVLSDMINNYASVFIRKTFVVADASAITHLTLAADYDDGFIAYLNGTEVARRNLPAGPIIHSTLALGNHESSRGPGNSIPATEEKEFIVVDPALLHNGTNVLAVSGHNAALSSSDLTLIIELYTNSAMVRGPFIQMPNPGNKASVVWRTAAMLNGAVDYGLDLSYSAGTVSNATLQREHVIELPDLIPGTTYYYRVRSNGEIISEGNYFHTRADTNQSFRFVVIGDHGQGTAGMYSIASRINNRIDFDMLMTVGDNIYGITSCNADGAPGWYDPFWFQLYGQSMKRVASFPALGNHDNDTATGKWTVLNFHLPTNGPPNEVEKNYSFEFGNVHFAVIDSDPFQRNVTAKMAEITTWLSNDLAQATQPWKMALFHHPAFTSQGAHNDNERVKSHIIPILKHFGVQYVFQGHNHFYERINAIDGIHYSTCGGCGAFLYSISNRKPFSARLVADRHSYTVVDINNTRLKLEQFDDEDNKIDEFNLDIGHEFTIDGLLDDPSWLRASNGMHLYAAIRGNYLYVATQDAGEGNDHFIYVADMLSTQRPANWSKSGTIMQWGAFLADENDGGYHAWFDASGVEQTDFEVYKSMTSGLNNNDPYAAMGVLEGSLNLTAHFGTFPQQLYLAVAPYVTTNGGHLISSAQVPAGNGDGDVQSNEFLAINPRDIALDLPVANAGVNQNVEAGMWAILNGTGSSSPSGLPLTFEWEQTSGPAVNAVNLDIDVAAFVITNNVAVNTDITFKLRVHDGRFYSDDAFVTVTLFPMVDTDGDGLSDFEELTGFNNILTIPDPNGNITDPNNPDSDGDGVSDGDEALAGTDPNDSSSLFKIVSGDLSGAQGILLNWSTISGRLYNVEYNTLLAPEGWGFLSSFLATSAVTSVTDTNTPPIPEKYYRIGVE